MGKYMYPQLLTDHEPLVGHGAKAADLHSSYMRNIQNMPGMVLVAVGDRGIFKFAADVTSLSEFEDFYAQYQAGMLLSFTVYAVTQEYFNANRSS